MDRGDVVDSVRRSSLDDVVSEYNTNSNCDKI